MYILYIYLDDIVSKWPEAHRRYRCSLHDSRPLRRWTWPWRTLENGELLANYGDNWIYIYYIILYYIIIYEYGDDNESKSLCDRYLAFTFI